MMMITSELSRAHNVFILLLYIQSVDKMWRFFVGEYFVPLKLELLPKQPLPTFMRQTSIANFHLWIDIHWASNQKRTMGFTQFQLRCSGLYGICIKLTISITSSLLINIIIYNLASRKMQLKRFIVSLTEQINILHRIHISCFLFRSSITSYS